MEMQTVVTLLTITVILLSVVIVTLLAIMIAVFVKIKRVMTSLDRVSRNVADATEWLTPARLFREFTQAFRRSK